MDLYYTDPVQHLDHDLSDLADELDDLDHDLSDLSEVRTICKARARGGIRKADNTTPGSVCSGR